MVLPRIWPMLENTMRAFTAVSNRVLFRSLEVIAATHDPFVIERSGQVLSL